MRRRFRKITGEDREKGKLWRVGGKIEQDFARCLVQIMRVVDRQDEWPLCCHCIEGVQRCATDRREKRRQITAFVQRAIGCRAGVSKLEEKRAVPGEQPAAPGIAMSRLARSAKTESGR